MQNNLESTWQWLSPEKLLIDTAWWGIYRNSFPIAERDTHEQLLHALRAGMARIGTHQHQGITQAIVVFYPMQIADFSFIFLNYIAVSNQKRGQGLGRQLFNQLISQFDSTVVWEVEDPSAAADIAEEKLRERRLQFYLRAGAQLLHCQFMQPPIDGLNYVPMRLMFHMKENSIDIHSFEKKIVEAIYFNKYKVINQIDCKILNHLLGQIFNEK